MLAIGLAECGYGKLRFMVVALFLMACSVPVSRLCGQQPPQDSVAATRPKVDRGELRYAREPFEHWRQVFLTDLDIETKVGAIVALQAFGKNGYRKEVIELLKPWMKETESRQLFSRAFDTMTQLAAIDALAMGLQNKNDAHREHAMTTVVNLGEEAKPLLPQILMAADGGSDALRLGVCRALAETNVWNEDVSTTLMNLIEDDSDTIRAAVCQALVSIGQNDDKTFAILDQATEDPEKKVRQMAYVAVQKLVPSKRAYELLDKSLDDDYVNIRASTCKAIGAAGINNDAAVSILTRALEDGSEAYSSVAWGKQNYDGQYVRINAAVALGTLNLNDGRDRVLEALATAAKNDHDTVRLLATVILGDLAADPGNEAAITSIERAIEDENSDIQSAAFASLASLESSRMHAVMARALENPSVSIRRATCARLFSHAVETEDPKAILLLKKALSDSSADVRLTASAALVQLNHASERMLDMLVQELNNVDDDTRDRAFEQLAFIAPNTKEMQKALLGAIVAQAQKQDRRAAMRAALRARDQPRQVRPPRVQVPNMGGGFGGLRVAAPRNSGQPFTPMMQLPYVSQLVNRPSGKAIAVAVLIQCLNDPAILGNGYRHQVIYELGNLGAEAAAAVPPLLKMVTAATALEGEAITDESMAIVRALGSIGPPAKSALPLLENLMRDDRILQVANDGRLQVAQAIRLIKGK